MSHRDLSAPRSRTGRAAAVALTSAVFIAILLLLPRLATSHVNAGGSDSAYRTARTGGWMGTTGSSLAATDRFDARPPLDDAPSGAAIGGDAAPRPAAIPGEAGFGPELVAVRDEATAGAETPAREPPVRPASVDTEGDAPQSGAVTLTLAAPVRAGDGGSAALEDLDDAEWTLLVENTGDEYLWGVYVYLEGHGPVDCEARRLDIGERTTCRVTTRVWAGEQTAEAWVTAWTTEWMVTDAARHDYVVAG